MSRRFLPLPALLGLLALCAPAEGAWNQPVAGGSPLNHAQTASAKRPSMAVIGGVPHVAWTEHDGTNAELRVSRLNSAGTAWVEVAGGASPLNHADDQDASSPALTAVAGVPFVAWSEWDGENYQLRASRLNAAGTAWEEIGGGGSSLNHATDCNAAFPAITTVGGVPYIAWSEHNCPKTKVINFDPPTFEIRVSRLNAAGDGWVEVVGGASPINRQTNTVAREPSLAAVGETLHVAWAEHDGTNDEIRVSRLNAAGDDWVEVAGGASPLNQASDREAREPSLASVGGVPHVAWVEWDGTNTELRVGRLNAAGTAWQQVVGGASPVNHDPAGNADGASLISIADVPYVSWYEHDGVNQEVRVARPSASGAAWEELVGGASPINESPEYDGGYPSLVSAEGVPWVAWTEDDELSDKLRVSRLEPELIGQSATPGGEAAALSAEWRTYGVQYGVGFVYGQSPQASTALQPTPAGTEIETVTQQLVGLTPQTAYEYSAFATAGVPEPRVQGPVASFETLAAVDTAAPETVLANKPPNRLKRRKATYGFSASESSAGFECKLDGASFAPCDSPTRLRRLKPGRHRFEVRAIDAAGNLDPTPASDRFRVVRRPG